MFSEACVRYSGHGGFPACTWAGGVSQHAPGQSVQPRGRDRTPEVGVFTSGGCTPEVGLYSRGEGVQRYGSGCTPEARIYSRAWRVLQRQECTVEIGGILQR